MNVIGSTALNILRGNFRWLWFCFPALPQQKSQRREAATVHQHTWPVSYQSLDHKVEESQHSTHYLVALQSHVCFYNDCNNLSSFFLEREKKGNCIFYSHLFILLLSPFLWSSDSVFLSQLLPSKRKKVLQGPKSTLGTHQFGETWRFWLQCWAKTRSLWCPDPSLKNNKPHNKTKQNTKKQLKLDLVRVTLSHHRRPNLGGWVAHA